MLLLALSACDPDGLATTQSWEDTDGAVLEAAPAGLVWTQSDGTAHSVSFLLVEAGSPDFAACSYDPWWLYDERAAAGTLASAGFEADVSERCNGGLDFRSSTGLEGNTVYFEGDRTAILEVDTEGPGLRMSLVADEADGVVPWLGIVVGTTESEAFYGLGETFDSILHRGHVRPMQIEIEIARESGYNEVHVPVPLLVSSASWGMLVDSFRPGVFDVAATRPDAVTALFEQEGEGLTVDLYAPPTPGEVTGRYWERTGAPEVPPHWAFAPLHWRNANVSGEEVLEDARTMRALGVATGVMWVDNPWQSAYNSMQPDSATFPDWDGMVDELHALGFRFMAWTTPYVEDTDPEHAWYEAEGWLVQDQLLFSDFGDLVELTNPDAAEAWAGRVSAARDRGIEGWKLDYGEDVQLGLFGSRLKWSFANGEDERTMHHQFATYYHEPYVTPYDEAGMLLGRAGVMGGQTVTDVIWPGDLDNGFERWDDVEDDQLLVGGLVSAIHGGTGLSVSGYPFYASDTGGYRGGRPTKESFIRWMEYAAILPIWQYGGAGHNHNPWDFTAYDDSQFDQETLDTFLRYAELHTRLWPYYQNQVTTMLETGVPIVLPQGLREPDGGAHSETDFFVGHALFVGTVIDAGQSSWHGALPAGEWVHWWSGELLSGEVVVPAPLGEGPLFQRVGSVVPLLRRGIDTLAPATVDGVESWANDPGQLNARIVPGLGAKTSTEDGATIGAESAGTVTLNAGSAFLGWDVEVYAPGASVVEADGSVLSVGVEYTTPWVRVTLPAGNHVLSVR